MKRRTTEDAGEIKFGPEVAPGVHSALRKNPDGTIDSVTCKATKNGEPLGPNSEICHVTRGKDGWHKLTRLAGGDGPAQVATSAYRDGFDRIFGTKTKVGLA